MDETTDTKVRNEEGIPGLALHDPAEWSEKVRVRGSLERERFVLVHAPMVRYIAQRILSRLPSSVELADLVNDGLVGLIEAIERFDPARGVRFGSFADQRVRGAILDALRARDMASRSLRRRLRALDSAVQKLEQQLGRAPKDEELAVEMGVDAASIADLRRDRENARPASSDARTSETAQESGLYSTSPDPFERLSEIEMQDKLTHLIDDLPPRDKTILGLYYEQGLTMKEIGEVLGITESRVCQIHTRTVKALGKTLKSMSHAATASSEKGRR